MWTLGQLVRARLRYCEAMVRSGLKQTGWTSTACASAQRLMNVPFCRDGPIYYRLTWKIIAEGYRASVCTLPRHHNKAIVILMASMCKRDIYFMVMQVQYLLFADNFAPLSLKGRVLFKYNIQEGVLPFLNDRICIWSRLHNIEKRDVENYN